MEGGAFRPSHPIKRLIQLEPLAFNSPGPELQPSIQPSTPGLQRQSPWPFGQAASLAQRPKGKRTRTLTWSIAPSCS